MKLFLIDPHDKRLYNNGIYNIEIDPNLIIWKNIRKYLLSKNIILDTIDLHPLEEADKIFFLDHGFFSLFNLDESPYLKICQQKKISKNRLNLVITECPVIKPESWLKKNHQYYGKVFTWDDILVDNKKYFHYLWTQNLENTTQTKAVDFKKKKFLTLMNSYKTNYLPNELYSLRVKAIRYFENKLPKDFDLYGIDWDKPLKFKYVYSALKYNLLKIPNFFRDYINSLSPFSSYKGYVKDKIKTLSQYKYCLCFENMSNINGYITEKIFDCFKARCVPVYYGASNIDRYIPSNTFIDFRLFKNFDKLYKYLIKIDENVYSHYMNNIESLIKKNQLKKWDSEAFCYSTFLHRDYHD